MLKLKSRRLGFAVIVAAGLAGLALVVRAETPATAPSAATTPATQAAPTPELAIYPPDVNLESSRDFQSVIVCQTRPDGVTHDVTNECAFSLSDPKLARLDGHVLRPLADGTGQLLVKFGDKTLAAPLTVKGATEDRPISFKLDVMPVFMRAGCNVGGCHGSARGKDGFRLSLFGYDPDGDYLRLTREWPGRRVNLAIPEDSLLLLKAAGKVPHTGGTLFKEDDELYKTVLRWLQAGAPHDPETVATPVSLELYPKQMLLEGEGASQQLTARAKYSDGTDRDVTPLVVFLSNNDNSAPVSKTGLVTASKRGEGFVMARFSTFTVGSQVIVIPKDVKYAFPADARDYNYIDALVDAKLKKMRIDPSPVCDDDTFLRRAYIDVIGRLPTPEQTLAFVSDSSPDKRDKLIDELLGRKEFVDLWVMKFAELLKIRSDPGRQMSYKATLMYFNWLQDKFAHNVPMDQIVQQLISASGGTFDDPATNYYQVEQDRLKLSENTAQVFMGMRIQCAQCHNHPFDRWTMNDYYSFSAFFSQIGRKQAEDPRELIVFNSGGGDVYQPITGQLMKPKFLGGDTPDVKGKDRREVLAKWLASPSNPYFAKNLANIVWAHFLGKGIVDPVDDMRVSNPAVNPELLEALATRFQEYHYDFKRLVRDICTSRTYQLATSVNPTNELDTRNFSHGPIRRIRAEVLLDAISQVTETKEKFRGLPLGARAVQIADGQTTNYFLTTFGRASRETVCSCEVKMEPNLSQALHMINGDSAHNRVISGGVVARLLAEGKSPEQIVDNLYERCLSRKPTPAELSQLMALMPKDPDGRRQSLEDVFWALLNSDEFMFNH